MGPTSHLCYTKPPLLASADSCCQSQEMQLAKELHLQCSWWWIKNDSFFIDGCAVAMLKMGAVEEQQKRFKKLSTNFSKRLAHHLNNLFIHQVIGTVCFWGSCVLTFPPHPLPTPGPLHHFILLQLHQMPCRICFLCSRMTCNYWWQTYFYMMPFPQNAVTLSYN